MPVATLDDGGWGTIASNFASALSPDPNSRARTYLMGAQYQKLLQEQEEKRRQMEALAESIKNYPNTIPPNLDRIPVNPDGTQDVGPPSPGMQSTYTTQRNQRIADNAAATLLANNAQDFAKGVHGNRAMGAIAAGIPSGQGQQDVLQTQLSGIGGSLPNYATAPHTFQPTDASGTAQGPAISSRRIPEGPATMVAPGKAGAVNHFDSPAAEDARLLALTQKLARDPNGLSIQELEEAAVHLQNRHGVKQEIKSGPDGSIVRIPVRERAIPEVYNPLVAQIAMLNEWKAQQGGQQPAPTVPGAVPGARPGAVPALPSTTGGPAAPPPDARVGGLAGTPPAPVAGAPAPVVGAPGAKGGTISGLPVGSDVGEPTQVSAGDASPIRKEFLDQQPVKAYFRAITPYKQFVENIKVGTAQADVSMIYNMAKMLDPESVVREGEMLIWKKSGGPFDQLKGLYDRVVENKASLTPQIRANLADMAERVMKPLHGAYIEQADRYKEIAGHYGIPAEKVVPKSIADLPKIDRKSISSLTPEKPGTPAERKASAAAAKASEAPATTAPTPTRTRTIRVNPQTGQIEDVQ